MDRIQVLNDLTETVQKVLKNTNLKLTPETSAKDVDGWDSITHVMIVVQVEKRFKKRFSSKEIQRWQTVNDMIDSITKS